MKRFRVGGVVALAAGVVGMVGGGAFAQPVSRPASVQLTQGDWNFVPVVTQDGGTISIPGVLALRDKAADVGDNIVAVWYENPNAPATGWPAQAWESKDQWDAIKWVKEQYEIDDGYDFVWPTSDPMTDPAAEGGVSELPKDYFGGLLVGDPLFDFATQPDGDQIVAVLASVGYKAASIPVDKDGPCDTKVTLPALADAAALYALFDLTEVEVQTAFAALTPQGCGTVVAAKWRPGLPPAPYGPRAPVPLAPVPYTDPDPPAGLPGPVTFDPNKLNWRTQTTCAMVGLSCCCVYYEQFASPTPGAPVIYVRYRCCAPATGCTGTTDQNGAVPPVGCVFVPQAYY